MLEVSLGDEPQTLFLRCMDRLQRARDQEERERIVWEIITLEREGNVPAFKFMIDMILGPIPTDGRT